jgi:hypothetical protein
MFVDPCIIVQFIKKIQQNSTVYQNFILPYLYEAHHVLGDTPPIIWSQNCTGSLWFFIRERLLDVQMVDVVRHSNNTETNQLTMYKAKVAVCSALPTKHSMQSKNHVRVNMHSMFGILFNSIYFQHAKSVFCMLYLLF